jgi:two-component system nitrate/nitrite response regulator NarL
VPLDPRVAATLVEQWREMRGDGPDPAPTGGRLSARELDVLAGMSRGETTKGVARTLGVSVKTIENHKTRIFAKLGVRSQAEAVAVAIGRGLLAHGAGRPDAG